MEDGELPDLERLGHQRMGSDMDMSSLSPAQRRQLHERLELEWEARGFWTGGSGAEVQQGGRSVAAASIGTSRQGSNVGSATGVASQRTGGGSAKGREEGRGRWRRSGKGDSRRSHPGSKKSVGFDERR